MPRPGFQQGSSGLLPRIITRIFCRLTDAVAKFGPSPGTHPGAVETSRTSAAAREGLPVWRK